MFNIDDFYPEDNHPLIIFELVKHFEDSKINLESIHNKDDIKLKSDKAFEPELFKKEEQKTGNNDNSGSDDNEIEPDFKNLEMVQDEPEEQNDINIEQIQNIKKNIKFEAINIEEEDLPESPKTEEYIRKLRTKINKWYNKSINEEIKESELPKKLKNKIHLPNYNKFTRRVKYDTTLEDLQNTMSKILCFGRETKNLQKKNYKNIQAIREFYKTNPTETVGKIMRLLEMTYEEVIKKFSESSEFEKLKRKKIFEFYDEELKREKNISLREKDGPILLFLSYSNKNKKNEEMLGKKRCGDYKRNSIKMKS